MRNELACVMSEIELLDKAKYWICLPPTI